MIKTVELNAADFVKAINSLKNWDESQVLSTTVSGTDMAREFLVWLADVGQLIADKYPHVEIIAYAKRWSSFPRGSVLINHSYSGHNFASSPETADIIAANLRYQSELYLPDSLSVDFCVHTGGRRFLWEQKAGLQSPTPIYNGRLNEEEVIWTPAEALAWAKKNWRPNVNLPEAIKASIYRDFGLGEEHKLLRSDGHQSVWYSLPPEDLKPDGWTPPLPFEERIKSLFWESD